MAFSNKQQINSTESSVWSLAEIIKMKQDVIYDGDLSIDNTMGLQKTFDDFSDVLDTKPEILSSTFDLDVNNLKAKSVEVIGTFEVITNIFGQKAHRIGIL